MESKVRGIGVVYYGVSKESVKSCRMKSKDIDRWWRILEEAKAYLGMLYH
jgi:hypothetical protein